MKIGLVLTSPGRSVSVRHVFASVRDALAGRHELVHLPPSLAFAPEAEQQRLAGEFVAACDAIVGLVHPAVLAARQRAGRRVPYLVLMLGTLPRGAFRFRDHVPRLTADDVLVVNSEADRRLCRIFFPDAPAPVVPLAYDDRSFHPLDGAERRAVRAELGFEAGDRVLLYPGRIIPEKNLHGLLRAFRVLLEGAPDLHLVLAGRIESLAFTEFGVTPTNFARTLALMGARLGIPEERILCTGAVSPGELRELYGAADVAVNLTLHHDENFGLAQVEAMACGTPVVGTLWGGLKDTISDGVTGYGVTTLPTPLGVKASWWEAACRVHGILADPETARRLGEAGPRHASLLYSPARLRERLEELLREHAGRPCEAAAAPLRVGDFARELWETCDPDADVRPPFRRGPRAMELYLRLVEPYTGSSPIAVPIDAPLEDGQLLSLATPVEGDPRAGLWADDPLYPLACEVPADHQEPVRELLALLAAEPVVTVERLSHLHSGLSSERARALAWMIGAGLVLRSLGAPGGIAPSAVPPVLARPLLSYERLPPDGPDFVVSG